MIRFAIKLQAVFVGDSLIFIK